MLQSSATTSGLLLMSLTQLVEDCTDSDYNSSVSTTRRNAVLQGLNDVRDPLTKVLYEFMQYWYGRVGEGGRRGGRRRGASRFACGSCTSSAR